METYLVILETESFNIPGPINRSVIAEGLTWEQAYDKAAEYVADIESDADHDVPSARYVVNVESDNGRLCDSWNLTA